MQKRCPMRIEPIGRTKWVFFQEVMEIRRGKAERRRWAGGDLTLWWSKLGDYMLVAPHRLVLLQGPNCSAILSFPSSVVKARCRCMLQCNCSYHLSRSSNSGNMVEKIKYGWLLPDLTGHSLFRIRRWSVGAFRQLWWIMSHIWLFFLGSVITTASCLSPEDF